MAREGGGGGGAFGWTLLGILVGVAGTLAVETLLSNQQARQANEEPAGGARVVIAAAPAAPKAAIVKPTVSVSAAPAQSVKATPAQEDVEDDAAAAGMTSRSRPSDTQGQPGPAGAPN
jgi:hypothetical protein